MITTTTVPQVTLVPRCWFQPHCFHPRPTAAQNHPQAAKNFPNFLSRPGSPRPKEKVGKFFAKVSRQVRTRPPPQNKNRFQEGQKSQTQEHRHADSLAKLCGNDRPRPTGDGIYFATKTI